jgi:hypothetical protein
MQFIKTLLAALFCLTALSSFAQTTTILSGTITDKRTGEALPFATVSLKKSTTGSLSNEKGAFDILLPAGSEKDSLIVSFLGYATQRMALSALGNPVNIKLEKSGVSLAEAVIRSLTPEQYLLLAIRSIKDNYANQPFQTLGYYRERAQENKNYLKDEEAVFKTYYPNYVDTARNQHQLLLHRKGETKPIQIYRDKIDKALKEENKEARKNGEQTEELSADDLISNFGGPEAILNADFISSRELFLDSTKFKRFKFSFGAPSSFLGKELITINFESRKAVEYQWQTGKLFMDPYTFAIVSVDFTAFIELPVLAQPALFALGVGLEDIAYQKKYNYYELNGRWYPQNFRVEGSARLIRKHVFKANEVSDFKLEQLFMISEITSDNPQPVDKAKRYTEDKKFEEQLHNDTNLKWEDVNSIKR